MKHSFATQKKSSEDDETCHGGVNPVLNLENVNFLQWKNCLKLSNELVELIVSTGLGPRIISFRSLGGKNVFGVFEDGIAHPDPAKQTWKSFGGHRLWMAPEIFPRTYYPDYDPVDHHFDGKTLFLKCVTEKGVGLQKEIEITMEPDSSRVTVLHRVYNRNRFAVEFAPWALSVMACGGRAIIPQEPYVPHGKEPGETFDPARPLVLWPFTNMSDPRFCWGEKYVTLREDETLPAKQKIGVTNKVGWIAYALNGELFVIRQPYEPGANYPDYGCNAEFFTRGGMLEMESLGPLRKIEPDDCAELTEHWEILPVCLSSDQDEMERQLNAIDLRR